MKKLFLTLGFIALPMFAQAQIIDESSVHAISNDALLTNETRGMNSTQAAFIESKPYDTTLFAAHAQGAIHKVRLREMMETSFFFPEPIRSYVLGDSRSFKWKPSNDRRWGSITNKLPETDTNLTLIGESGAVYSFYLRVYTLKSDHVPHLTVFVTNDGLKEQSKTTKAAKYSKEKQRKEQHFKAEKEADGEYLRSLPDVDVTTLNYGYHTKGGNSDLAPSLIFDDGKWTYFKFGDRNLDQVRRLPTIYRVVDGVDEPVNTREVNGTLIAETTNPKGWTLRHGTSHLCVRKNDQ